MSYQQIAPYSGHSSTESTPSPHSAPRALPFTTPGASSSKPKPPTRSIPAPPSSPSSSSMLQITPAPRHTHTHSHTQSLSAPSRRSHEEDSHAGGATFLPSVPLADLFAPHSDGRHCVCRVCKAMLSGTMSAMRGHLMVFHKAGDAQF